VARCDAQWPDSVLNHTSFDFAGQLTICRHLNYVPIARNFITVFVLLEFI
jgi:hypothetical protein